MHTITIQPSDRVDGISPDGTERTQRPYPFHVSPDGMVQRQDFWRGKVAWIVGFTETPDQRTIPLSWDRAAAKLLFRCESGSGVHGSGRLCYAPRDV